MVGEDRRHESVVGDVPMLKIVANLQDDLWNIRMLLFFLVRLLRLVVLDHLRDAVQVGLKTLNSATYFAAFSVNFLS